jgi:hypothetical protein
VIALLLDEVGPVRNHATILQTVLAEPQAAILWATIRLE